MQVAEGKVVSFHYTLTSDQTEGVVDSSDGREPMPYLHGAGNIVPGLEARLLGKASGDKVTAEVPPSEAYGDRQEGLTQTVPRTSFPEDAPLQPGMQVMAETPEGQRIPLWLASVSDTEVTVDPNHPLAGHTLTFEVEIVEIRDATEDEKSHGHPHGPGGHNH